MSFWKVFQWISPARQHQATADAIAMLHPSHGPRSKQRVCSLNLLGV